MADDSKNADVGARYAQALFELAVDADQSRPGAFNAVEADIKGFRRLIDESVDLKRLIANPAFTAEDKGRALGSVADAAGVHPLTRKFIGLLAANNRPSALPAVLEAFERMAAERRGAVSAEVVTALPLTEVQRQGVAAALRQALGRDPEIITRVDPAILGGLRVKVGSRLFDASLKTRLDSLRIALKRA